MNQNEEMLRAITMVLTQISCEVEAENEGKTQDEIWDDIVILSNQLDEKQAKKATLAVLCSLHEFWLNVVNERKEVAV